MQSGSCVECTGVRSRRIRFSGALIASLIAIGTYFPFLGLSIILEWLCKGGAGAVRNEASHRRPVRGQPSRHADCERRSLMLARSTGASRERRPVGRNRTSLSRGLQGRCRRSNKGPITVAILTLQRQKKPSVTRSFNRLL